MSFRTIEIAPPLVEYYLDGKPLIYRVGTNKFTGVVQAECHKIDTHDRRSIELWYKDRWNIMGDIPNARRIAL